MPIDPDMVRKFITATNLSMKEAVALWKGKTPLSQAELDAKIKVNHDRSFAVAGITDADMLQRVYDEMSRALQEGIDFREFKKKLADVWETAGFTGKNAWRVENVFRTNLQSAYSAGRYQQMQRVAKRRPYWRYRAVGDNRTRPSHQAMNGKVFAADDPIWNTWYPPNGYQCRCTVQSLSQRQVDKLGIDVKPGKTIIQLPDSGFRNNPGREFFKPSLEKYRADVRQNTLSGFVGGLCSEGEYAERKNNPCLAKLKKLLNKNDLAALETMMWEKKVGGVDGFANWVDAAIERGSALGEVYPVGNLPSKVLSRLKKQPLLALVIMRDDRIFHMLRGPKVLRGAALTVEEIKDISARFITAEWYIDSKDPSILMTWQRVGDKWLKVVIRTDQRIGGVDVIANEIVTAGVVRRSNLEEKKYKKL